MSVLTALLKGTLRVLTGIDLRPVHVTGRVRYPASRIVVCDWCGKSCCAQHHDMVQTSDFKTFCGLKCANQYIRSRKDDN